MDTSSGRSEIIVLLDAETRGGALEEAVMDKPADKSKSKNR